MAKRSMISVAPLVARAYTAIVAGRRAAVKTVVYDTVDPSSLIMDSITPNWDGVVKPEGCASITNLVKTDPGGRAGGTPISVQVFNPSASPVGKCLLILAGHGAWTQYYVLTDGTSIVLRMLALGWHVMVADMPNYGIQPTQRVIINGVAVTQVKNTWYAPKNSAKPYDGPNVMRLFVDHLIAATTWAIGNLTANVHLAGHSGGASEAICLACLDDRFRTVHVIQGNSPTAPWDYEVAAIDWTGNDIYVVGGDKKHLFLGMVAADVPGRKTVLHAADHDEYHGDDSEEWERWFLSVGPWSQGKLEYYRKHGNHDIDAPQAAWVEQHLVEHS